MHLTIKFLGTSSALRAISKGVPENTAYIIHGHTLLLIDCGYTAISKLIRSKILKNIDEIYVAITHCHNDHVGGLAPLILDCFYKMYDKNIRIHLVENDLKEDIRTYLHKQGVFSTECTLPKDAAAMYDFCQQPTGFGNIFSKIRFEETPHIPYMKCYSIIFETSEGLVLYTGDTSSTKLIEKYLGQLCTLYTDVRLREGGPHVSLSALKKVIPISFRKHVYCMHFNKLKCKWMARIAGFKVAKEITPR